MTDDSLILTTSASRPGERRQDDRRGWLLVAVATMLFVATAAGSLLPPHYKDALHTHGRFHSWIHVVCFGVLAFVAVRGARSSRMQAVTFFCCLTFGWSIEAVEFLTYHARFEWRDCFTDAVGITFATLVALLLSS